MNCIGNVTDNCDIILYVALFVLMFYRTLRRIIWKKITSSNKPVTARLNEIFQFALLSGGIQNFTRKSAINQKIANNRARAVKCM